jgi:hypothetical protein
MMRNKEPVQNAVLLHTDKNHLPVQRLKLLQEHDISLKEVDETCNGYDIKVIECQSGCFK